MNELEQQLLREEMGENEPRLVIRTGTRIDGGRWWRGSPVWLCLFADELALLAVGRRRYFERVSLAECSKSHYELASGQLVIEPSEGLRCRCLKMPPSTALELLNILKPTSLPVTSDQ